MARRYNERNVIQRVIKKNLYKNKKDTVHISIKLNKELHSSIVAMCEILNISKNRLIEDILYESGIMEEIDENYVGIKKDE